LKTIIVQETDSDVPDVFSYACTKVALISECMRLLPDIKVKYPDLPVIAMQILTHAYDWPNIRFHSQAIEQDDCTVY